MPDSSLALNAAICAIRGESHLDIVKPALGGSLTRVIALAPNAHPAIRSVAALCCYLPALLDELDIADPALHDALARMIGSAAGRCALWTLAQIAPAGWGYAHRAALADAVKNKMCDSYVAAALIGSCDMSAALLHDTQHIAFAIRRWGESSADAPTAWMDALSHAERDRLIHTVQRDPFVAASCLPWLPRERVHHIRIDDNVIDSALSAFACASPTARAQHAALLQRLIAQTHSKHLSNLTHLACAMQSKEVWKRVQTLIRTSLQVNDVVIAARWNDLANHVRTAILNLADRSDACAAVAAARGRSRIVEIKGSTATAFFAALDPNVWDALDANARYVWRRALWERHAHLAVRSLGLRTEILAAAHLYNDLVDAASIHAPTVDALRWSILPMALRDISPGDAYALVHALPSSPPDPIAFFCIASKHTDQSLIARSQVPLHTPDSLACAIVLQRSADNRTSTRDRCTALQEALRGRSWNDVNPMHSLLTKTARTICMPRTAAIVQTMAHPDRQDALHHVLDRLASLPPEIAIPTYVALTQSTSKNKPDAAEALAHTLRAHGDLFLMVVSALTDDLRTALLPLPEDASQANALRDVARNDPPTAQRLAHALHGGDWRTATQIVLSLPKHHRAVWAPTSDALVERLALPEQREALRKALDRFASLPPEVDLLVRFALDMGTNRDRIEAAEDIAHALRSDGDVFLAIVDALKDDRRTALLPLPRHADQANALRDLARDDPPTAQRLAHALRGRDWRDALHALMDNPLAVADIWSALGNSERSAIVNEMVSMMPEAADLIRRDPVAGLALAAARSDDADRRDSGVAALEARTDILRAIWDELPQAMQQSLLTYPSIALSVADLPQPHDPAAVRRFRIR